MNPKVQHQIELEKLYSKNELMPRMRKFFTDASAEEFLEDLGIDFKFGMTVLVQMALHKRCDFPTLFGLCRNHFDSANECAAAIQKAVDAGIVTWNSNTQQFITVLVIDPETQAEIDKFQYPLPMVVRPNILKSNSDTGFLSAGRKGSVILKDNHHEDDVCLDHLNRMNQIKMEINLDTAVMVGNKWRNLDKPKTGETVDDFNKRKRAFAKYSKHAYEVIDMVLKEGNEFYLTHRYDKRGRVYSQGHYINPQGTEWNRAVIEFSIKEKVNG